ncbi:MAG: type VI secretion system baseplate subunit TssF [Desulfovibrio sp.]|jgi:type VI secretion system protein ImpG|nr:type VI secretion system baseplate subunit TssF [Desulfovibrio sp.]
MDTAWYYQRELKQLRTLAAEFSRAHPAVAPLLAGPSSDPDVERLLEGAAYLTGQLAQKLDESYDRIAENLISIVLPQLLRDVPSCTIMQFTPKAAMRAPLVIPKGSRVGSVEIDGVSCVFSTTCPVELAPMRLAGVRAETGPGKPPHLRLDFVLTAPGALDGLTRLRLYLTGPRANTAQRLYALFFYTTGISLEAGKTRLRLPASSLRSAGFVPEEGLFPYPSTAWEGYRLLQEYYIFPEKFFFLDIMLPDAGIPAEDAANLACTLELEPGLPDDFPTFAPEDFVLFATPAVNLFPFETLPIREDLRRESYPVRANATRDEAYVPYLVESVKAVGPTGEERRYTPLPAAPPDSTVPAYTVRCPKKADGRREMQLFPLYPPDAPMPETSVFSLEALYSNGELPSRLNIGDVRMPLSTSPALAEFANLTPPTRPALALADGDTLWAMLAHLHLNYLPLADAPTLKALLSTYLPPKADALYANANKRRIEAILAVVSEETDFLWKGRPIRGSDLAISLDGSGFSNPGDMCLFGMVVARFLHEYSPINSFMRVTVTDSLNQKAFQWLKHQPYPSRL